MKNKYPKVGIGVLVIKDGKVLLGKRKGSHGAGEYGFPGGHLEFGESYEECIRRECREEIGIEVKDIKFLCLSRIQKYSGKDYVDLGFVVKWQRGELQTLEPEKCEFWDWYSLDKLPTPLFGNEHLYFETLKTGKNFF